MLSFLVDAITDVSRHAVFGKCQIIKLHLSCLEVERKGREDKRLPCMLRVLSSVEARTGRVLSWLAGASCRGWYDSC